MPDDRRNEDDTVVMVHAYLDGELNISEAIEAERAIAASGALAAEASAVGALKQALQARLAPEPLPKHLSDSIAARLGLRSRAPRPGWLALAASVLVAVALSSTVTSLVLRSAPDSIYADSVDSHLRALMAPQPVDIAANERHVVKPWFNGKSVQSPKVADLAAQGFPLVGGRIDVVHRTPVPALVYKRRAHVISVWAGSEAQAGLLNKATTSVGGTNVVVWRAGDLTYWAASDLNAAELANFAKLFAEAP